MKKLIIIPARKGSKGLPGKNTKLLGSKPLISYSIEYAIEIKGDNDVICITTNDDSVIEIAKSYGLEVPFKRPENLASDSASTYNVIIHSLNYFEEKEEKFDAVLLLQPTSPFRSVEDFKSMLNEFDEDCDMVVSVKKVKDNPYFNLFEENTSGYLEPSKNGHFNTRQECPTVYAYNGSLYLIRVASLLKSDLGGFTKIKKTIMPEERSIDIDTMRDWILADFFLNQ